VRLRAPFLLLLLAAGCADGGGEPPAPPPPPEHAGPERPQRVTWDQILVAFEGSYPRVETYRSQEEAKTLAYSILDRLRSGVAWDLLKREYSDDRQPQTGIVLGPYVMVEAKRPERPGDVPRNNYPQAFGDLVFGMKPGEVGIVDYDPKHCPLGWHILKVLHRE